MRTRSAGWCSATSTRTARPRPWPSARWIRWFPRWAWAPSGRRWAPWRYAGAERGERSRGPPPLCQNDGMARLEVDLLVVGGGIHGAGIARDATGRGLTVALVEQGDLAGATSSASSKLAHGGLRYLEQFDFRLVREALQERETLMRIAPHLEQPLPFFLPASGQIRPGWQLRA